MSDRNLRDDDVKLVSYSIVCIERGRERTLVCNESKVFNDNMSDCDFETWVIADYVAGNPSIPCDRRDLRVAYEVKGRWPQQDLHYEERQLAELRGIKRAILDSVGGVAPHHRDEHSAPGC